MKELSTTTSLTGKNSALNTQKTKLQDQADAFGLGKPFQDKLKELDAQLAATRAKLEAVGQSESSKILAEGYAKASLAIAEVNKALEKHHTALTISEAAQIRSREVQLALAEAQEQWKQKFTQATDAIEDRIKAQERLDAAIGGSYDQRRSAAVQNGTAQTVGAVNANDPEFLRNHAAEVQALQNQLGREFDAQEGGRNTKSLQKLQDKIDLTNALANAERKGTAAVREAELAERIRIATDGLAAEAADKLTAKMREEAAADLHKDSEKDLATLREKVAAMDSLANAFGQQARLQAESKNAYNAAIQGNKSPEVAQAEAQEVLRRNQDEILTKAGELASAYSDQLAVISQTETALKNIAKTQGDSLQIEAALKDLDDQRLKLIVDNDLKQGAALDGVHAFFTEMQEQAEKSSQIIYDALNSALNKTVYAGGSYMVGEHAPEIFTPRNSGTITPLHKMGSPTYNTHYNVDARGAEIGVENRVSQALEHTHQSAVQTAVRAQAERTKRTPMKSGR